MYTAKGSTILAFAFHFAIKAFKEKGLIALVSKINESPSRSFFKITNSIKSEEESHATLKKLSGLTLAQRCMVISK